MAEYVLEDCLVVATYSDAKKPAVFDLYFS
jgi:hypothetical protein